MNPPELRAAAEFSAAGDSTLIVENDRLSESVFAMVESVPLLSSSCNSCRIWLFHANQSTSSISV
jgi:hypothetical protein